MGGLEVRLYYLTFIKITYKGLSIKIELVLLMMEIGKATRELICHSNTR